MVAETNDSNWFVDDDGLQRWLDRLSTLPAIERHSIGQSRQGRSMYGFKVGNGPVTVTITAGAHADEPAGPLAAMRLVEQLGRDPQVSDSFSELTFLICPQVNPDGAQANSPWFAPVPDVATYLRHVQRELPGDDVEFGYPGRGKGALRLENQAVVDFFSAYPPAAAHASLHSMAFAEGAWYLLGGTSIANTTLQQQLVSQSYEAGFRLHDIQRNGEKGFTRIGPGLCTTPNSAAMARFFEDQGDPATAAKFHLSSMEWTLERNPEAAILVTELPMFAISGGYQGPGAIDPPVTAETEMPAPEPGSTRFEQIRKQLGLLQLSDNPAELDRLVEEFEITPVPVRKQCDLMIAAVAQLVTNLPG